tara:strand:+ start:3453 stop:4229 length:777 start_codon:yes stop_codon:yes gene_type:complete
MENKFTDMFLEGYNLLKVQDDLSPNNKLVNYVLSSLVQVSNDNCCKLCSVTDCSKVQNAICDFRTICAKSECEMEKYWADIFNSKDSLTLEDLKSFWYYDNYELITDKEVTLMKRNIKDLESKKIIFVGSGSMPLTALIMHYKYGLDVTLLDMDREAVEKSQKLVKKLGLNITVEHKDFFEYNLSGFDVVFLASLVADKKQAIEKIKVSGTTHFLTRGADGVYKIFYDDLSDDIKSGMQYSYIPSDHKTLNSSYLFSL